MLAAFDFGFAIRSVCRTSAPDFIVTAVICQLGLQGYAYSCVVREVFGRFRTPLVRLGPSMGLRQELIVPTSRLKM
jgi:hypothetical protein